MAQDQSGVAGGPVAPSSVNLSSLPVTVPSSGPVSSMPFEGQVGEQLYLAWKQVIGGNVEGSGEGGGGAGSMFDRTTFSRASLTRYNLHSPFDLFGPISTLPIASLIQQAPYKAGQLAKAIQAGVQGLPGVRSEL